MLRKFQKLVRPNENFDEINSLTRIPDKEDPKTEMPHFANFKAGFTQQCDVLWMPLAMKRERILVVVDNNTKKCDAQCIIGEETSQKIAAALAVIYARGILTIPKILEVDAGKTNEGAVIEYCKKNNIFLRVAKTARHRMQAIVEVKNQIIARLLYTFINNQELTKYNAAVVANAAKRKPIAESKVKVVQSRNWYINEAHFRSVINFINDNTKAEIPNPHQNDFGSFDKPLISKRNQILLGVGTMVRIILETPVVIATQKKMTVERGSKGFGSTDPRWSKKVAAITWVKLAPSQPPLYRVGTKNILYTKQQLQVVTESNRGFA